MSSVVSQNRDGFFGLFLMYFINHLLRSPDIDEEFDLVYKSFFFRIGWKTKII